MSGQEWPTDEELEVLTDPLVGPLYTVEDDGAAVGKVGREQAALLAPLVAAREKAAAEKERKRHAAMLAILADEWADDPAGARDWARAYRVARADVLVGEGER